MSKTTYGVGNPGKAVSLPPPEFDIPPAEHDETKPTTRIIRTGKGASRKFRVNTIAIIREMKEEAGL